MGARDSQHDRGGAPERRDAAERRRRILAAARGLFAAQGVDAVCMHEIARAAGVGQGTLYRRFAHKGALCSALLANSAAAFQAEVAAAFAAAGPDAPALDRLALLLERVAAFNDEQAPLLGAIVDAAAGPRRAEAYGAPFYCWLRATTVELLHTAARQGELAPVDVECAADLILAPLAIDSYRYQREVRGISRERLIATLRRFFVDGLRAAP
jgi:AcrR family transcriptional regulator